MFIPSAQTYHIGDISAHAIVFIELVSLNVALRTPLRREDLVSTDTICKYQKGKKKKDTGELTDGAELLST